MEIVIPEGSPLADILEHGQQLVSDLEGEGRGERRNSTLAITTDFAPRPSPSLSARLRRSTIDTVHSRLPRSRTLSSAHQAGKRAAHHGLAEDAHFLDHFRYVLVASQLLEENPDHGALQKSDKSPVLPTSLGLFSYKGAAAASTLAFITVWVLTTAMQFDSRILSTLLITTHFAVFAAIIYLHGRRQIIRYVHMHALEMASRLVNDLQSFEIASSSALALVQEVEVVAKRFRSSYQQPQVDPNDAATLRRCMTLRRSLARSYVRMSNILSSTLSNLTVLSDNDDYDKFLDIYDIPREAIDQALPIIQVNQADFESLGALRVLSYRVATLRRAVLCALLSLHAGSEIINYRHWRDIVVTMETLSQKTAGNASTLVQCLESLEDLATPSTPVKSPRPSNDRIKAQVRKIANLSTGIKTLQAKMTLLREESNAAISRAEDLTDLGPALMTQYESVGADIDSLRLAWESGKAALSANIVEQEKRISLVSSPGPTSPPPFSPRMRIFSEGGSPADALLALTGQRLLPTSDASMSPISSAPATPSDEEVFEAVALPKQRSSLSREERIRIMHEERAKADERKARRESGLNMMRELRTVINLRKNPDTPPGARVTSI